MLEDGLFAPQDWLNANRDIAMRFIAACDRGWIYCRDHVQDCTNIVSRTGRRSPNGHQLWQMNEINKLIWPNTQGIGVMDAAAFKQTAAIALKYKVIKKAAIGEGLRRADREGCTQYLQGHVKGIDIYGKGYKPIAVTLTAGGK